MRYETCVPLFHCLEDDEKKSEREKSRKQTHAIFMNVMSFTNDVCHIENHLKQTHCSWALDRLIEKNVTFIGRPHKIQARIWNLNLYQTCTEPFKYKANKSLQRLLLYCCCCGVCVCEFVSVTGTDHTASQSQMSCWRFSFHICQSALSECMSVCARVYACTR